METKEMFNSSALGNKAYSELFFEEYTLKTLKKEKWVDCFGLECFYEVSNLGRIRRKQRVRIDSLGRTFHVKEKIISQIKIKHNKTFSLYVRLTNGIEKRNYTVASLILNSFKKPDRFNTITHHINFCTYDNRLMNLTFESWHNKRQIEYRNGIRNGIDTTEHFRLDGSLKRNGERFLDEVFPKNTKKFNGTFQQASRKYPVTIYFTESKEIFTYSSIRNCSEQTGILEQSLRNAMARPHKCKRFSIKKGMLDIDSF